jgi:hypothetical protein
MRASTWNACISTKASMRASTGNLTFNAVVNEVQYVQGLMDDNSNSGNMGEVTSSKPTCAENWELRARI